MPFQFIRGALWGLAVGTLLAGMPCSAEGQAVAQSGEVRSMPQAPASQQSSAQVDDSAQTGQLMSLGDLARVVRAKKEGAPKAVKVIDDENLPRNAGGISVVGSATAAREKGSLERLTLLDFWASWCGPCRESVPDLKALQRIYGSDQLEVISVNEDTNENAGRKFASESGMNWEVQFDPKGETSRQYGVQAFPTFILMDSSGQEVQRFVGEDPREPLADRIARFMPKAPKGNS
ncbi:MAG TPA: TlpA disulfide reductase family protein [Candidatus Acidoferrum sp.]|nr:TlpA disulfide reductase family protein [Candidatus Acidoferrum sp.]